MHALDIFLKFSGPFFEVMTLLNWKIFRPFFVRVFAFGDAVSLLDLLERGEAEHIILHRGGRNHGATPALTSQGLPVT